MTVSDKLWNELKRKSIHLSNIWIPILYFFVEYKTMLTVVSIGTLICLVLDVIRNEHTAVGRQLVAFLKTTGLIELFRPHEKDGRLTGATHMFLSSLICVVLFEKELFIMAFTILIISDTLAAIFGTAFGTSKSDTGKSVAGTEAFSMSALIISLVGCWYYKLSIFTGVVAAIATSIAEHSAGKYKLDDNFVVPITYCVVFKLVLSFGI